MRLVGQDGEACMSDQAKENDVIQLSPSFNDWGPLLCIVEEVKSWGVQCYALIPEKRNEVPSRMYLRVKHGQYVIIGPVVWAVQ